MCLQVSVRFSAQDERDIENLARGIEAMIPIEFSFDSLQSCKATVFLTSKGSSCGCSFLEDTAMPDDAIWQFRSEAAEALATAVEQLGKQRNREIEFDAIWLGPDREELDLKQIRVHELAELIRSSRISSTARYLTFS